MKNIDLKNITLNEHLPIPLPGGYVVTIVHVFDDERKEYLKIDWDYAEGVFAGHNQAVFDQRKFWPTPLYRSYKDTALGHLKDFVDKVEASNPDFHFDPQDIQALVGTRMGLVLGEEPYKKKDGKMGLHLYVDQVLTVDDIYRKAYTTPGSRRKTPR